MIRLTSRLVIQLIDAFTRQPITYPVSLHFDEAVRYIKKSQGIYVVLSCGKTIDLKVIAAHYQPIGLCLKPQEQMVNLFLQPSSQYPFACAYTALNGCLKPFDQVVVAVSQPQIKLLKNTDDQAVVRLYSPISLPAGSQFLLADENHFEMAVIDDRSEDGAYSIKTAFHHRFVRTKTTFYAVYSCCCDEKGQFFLAWKAQKNECDYRISVNDQPFKSLMLKESIVNDYQE